MCCHCNRREFLGVSAAALAGATIAIDAAALESVSGAWDPEKPFRCIGKPLRVQPVLMYSTPQPRPQTSWKSWGGIQTDAAAAEEAQRIVGELKAIETRAEFPVAFLEPRLVKSEDEMHAAVQGDFDTIIVYPATGGRNMLLGSLVDGKETVIFARHASGPVYYWYESLSTSFLEKNTAPIDPAAPKAFNVDDVVVDDLDELLWRLRALYAVKNLRGTRVFTLGGPWGKYSPEAPQIAKDKFGVEIIDYSYEAFEPHILRALQDTQVVARAEKAAANYLALPGTTLKTDRQFVVNAFVLYDVFTRLMEEHDAQAFTIKSCMGTIMPMSATTACLTLEIMNDDGLLAFCESDYVVIPPGILLRHIAAKPVFLHNSTFPHKGMVTCAHCTGPRRMDGNRYEPAEIVTHYESEYGAAPKVEMPIGQTLSFIDPEYSTGRWLGFRGTVKGNPFYDICRSQQDVEIEGQWKRLINEVRDSHWLMVYGDYLNEIGYAARHLGITWDNVSEGVTA